MECHKIDLEGYPRRDQFHYFRSIAQPYAGVTVAVDITNLCGRQQREGCAPSDFQQAEKSGALQQAKRHSFTDILRDRPGAAVENGRPERRFPWL